MENLEGGWMFQFRCNRFCVGHSTLNLQGSKGDIALAVTLSMQPPRFSNIAKYFWSELLDFI